MAGLVTAQEPFHVDVNVGDPIWPGPAEVLLPRLLKQEAIRLRGYPVEMVLAEKIVTAIHRGQASTRWRDFGDVYLLTGRHACWAQDMKRALQVVADHRHVELSALEGALDGYAEIGQARWAKWRSKLQPAEVLPAEFGYTLASLRAFANPLIVESVDDGTVWNPVRRTWGDPG